jgi:hypothetical protein
MSLKIHFPRLHSYLLLQNFNADSDKHGESFQQDFALVGKPYHGKLSLNMMSD